MRAALYLRSSKDRSDVSLSAQRRALEDVAKARGLTISAAYEDAVQSGNTEARPGFQRLLADLKNPSRGWSILLVYDTSRLARGRYIAQAFKHQCRRLGIDIVYARVPETDPVSAVILDAVFEAMDEVHSLMSREKGLAGMRENVRQGWRAGGRAPWGYRLKQHHTGAIRDGRPVVKTTLEVDPVAGPVQAFLKGRAGGEPRSVLMRDLQIDRSPSSLIGVEWNALVYAGHTVWNRHTEKARSGRKRRDRTEWEVQRDTHPALINDAEAEAILAQLETSNVGLAVSRAKAGMSDYLLSGLLESTDGRRWRADGPSYRLRPTDTQPGARISTRELEDAVTAHIRRDFADSAFAAELAAAVRQSADTPSVALGDEMATLRRQRQRAQTLAVTHPGEGYEDIAGRLTVQLAALQREAAALAVEDAVKAELRTITARQVQELLLGTDDDRFLLRSVGRIVLDPDLTCQLHYRLSVASPRGSDRWTKGVTRVVALRAANRI